MTKLIKYDIQEPMYIDINIYIKSELSHKCLLIHNDLYHVRINQQLELHTYIFTCTYV